MTSALNLENYYPDKDRPCDICGEIGNNGIEPRFGYVTCSTHERVPPAYRTKYKRWLNGESPTEIAKTEYMDAEFYEWINNTVIMFVAGVLKRL